MATLPLTPSAVAVAPAGGICPSVLVVRARDGLLLDAPMAQDAVRDWLDGKTPPDALVAAWTTQLKQEAQEKKILKYLKSPII